MVARRYIIKGTLGIFLTIPLVIGLVAAEFTEKREKKNVSTSTLKEECCEQFGELLKQIPHMLQMFARLQIEALTIIQGYWEGDKQSWCAQASRPKLLLCRDRLTILNKKMNNLLAECEQALKEIRG